MTDETSQGKDLGCNALLGERTEWTEIRLALRKEYGHAYIYNGVQCMDFSKHVYVGRAGALLLKAERQEAAARKVIEAFELLGRAKDTAGLLQARAQCENAMTGLKDVLTPNAQVHRKT